MKNQILYLFAFMSGLFFPEYNGYSQSGDLPKWIYLYCVEDSFHCAGGKGTAFSDIRAKGHAATNAEKHAVEMIGMDTKTVQVEMREAFDSMPADSAVKDSIRNLIDEIFMEAIAVMIREVQQNITIREYWPQKGDSAEKPKITFYARACYPKPALVRAIDRHFTLPGLRSPVLIRHYTLLQEAKAKAYQKLTDYHSCSEVWK